MIGNIFTSGAQSILNFGNTIEEKEKLKTLLIKHITHNVDNEISFSINCLNPKFYEITSRNENENPL